MPKEDRENPKQKMKPQEATPTIAELWGEFEPMAIAGNPCNYQTYEWHQWESAFNSLRSQLLERCKRVFDSNEGNSAAFEIIPRINRESGIETSNRNYTRFDSIATALEMSAAYAFWAWELFQRQKEGKCNS